MWKLVLNEHSTALQGSWVVEHARHPFLVSYLFIYLHVKLGMCPECQYILTWAINFHGGEKMRNISCSVFHVDCCGIIRHSGQLLPFVSTSLLESPTWKVVVLVSDHGMGWNGGACLTYYASLTSWAYALYYFLCPVVSTVRDWWCCEEVGGLCWPMGDPCGVHTPTLHVRNAIV